MKIVKFKNGTYGVRKWSWKTLEFVFALNKSGQFAEKSCFYVQEFDTLEYAVEVMKKITKNTEKNLDVGTAI